MSHSKQTERGPSVWGRSLKARLASFTLILLPVLGLLIYGYRAEYERKIDTILDSQTQTAEAIAFMVDTVFDEAIGIGWALANDPALHSTDPARLDTHLRRLAAGYPRYQVLAVFNAEADTFGTSGLLPGGFRRAGVGAVVPWIRQVLATGKPVVSPVFLGRGSIEGVPVIAVAVPLRDGTGATIGTVNIHLRLDALSERLAEIALGPEQTILLTDTTGTAAFHSAISDLSWERRDLSGFGPVKPALEGRASRLRRYVSPVLGERRIGSFLPTPKYGWVVGVNVREDVALAEVRSGLRTQLLALAAVALLSFGLILLLSRRILLPIRRLAAHARALGRGELGERVEIKSDDEIGGLGRAFNRMADELQLREARLRESEALARLQRDEIEAIYDSAPVGLAILDRQLRFTRLNRRLAEINGKPAAEHIGKTLQEVVPDQAAMAEALTAKILQTGEAVLDIELSGATASQPGVKRYWLEQWLPLKEAAGEVIGISVVVEEITERKRMEEELRKLNETLELQVAERTALAERRARQLQALALQLTEAEEIERRRIADLLHEDLQQLLSASRLQLSVLRPAVKGQADAERILHQVDRLLEQSIEKSRRLSHELSPAILHQAGLPAAVEWWARKMKEHHGLKVEVETSGRPPIRNEPLRVFMFRAVQEMLLNVVKHAGVNAAEVRIARREDRLEAVVADRGRGFDPESLKEPAAQGKGIGLFSIGERASWVGGCLKIESAPEQGTRLTLSVPIEALQAMKKLKPFHPAWQRNTPPEPARTEKNTHYRVLLADGHRVMRQGLIALLDSQPDIQVVGEASGGAEAVELARRLSPDAIVMGLSMPAMDGLEATRRIKRERPRVRVIGLSMPGGEDVADRMKEAGADAYLSKAEAAEALVEAIRGQV